MKKIAILGSTGSIGTNALDIIARNPDKFKVVGLAAGSNHGLLARQARRFGAKSVAICDKDKYNDLKKNIFRDTRIYVGMDGVAEIARMKNVDQVLVAIGGTSSIMPLIEAIKAGKQIALASKETLVSAGGIVMDMARNRGVDIIPVDSEHSAIFQCLMAEGKRHLRQIYLTGTGGPLRNISKDRFDRLPVSRVIKHPKWKMGRKITVDSATLMNKGLEVIEAKWLFDVDTGSIRVVLHPEAFVHSMIEFDDGAILANMFQPDMRIPISFAFSYPDRIKNNIPFIDFFRIKNFTFERPDHRKFPALRLAYKASASQSSCAVLNAANEQAVSAFLNREIRFTKIISIVEKVLSLHRRVERPTLDQILGLDRWAKEQVDRLIG